MKISAFRASSVLPSVHHLHHSHS